MVLLYIFELQKIHHPEAYSGTIDHFGDKKAGDGDTAAQTTENGEAAENGDAKENGEAEAEKGEAEVEKAEAENVEPEAEKGGSGDATTTEQVTMET